MPEDRGDLYVTVNIPEFTLRIVKNGAVIHTERVITGLVDKQTPVFSETMKSIAFQPRWNVPNSIKVQRAVSEPGARRHLVPPPGPASVAQWPRHRPRERRLELDRHPHLRRLPAAGRQQRAGRVEVQLPQQAHRLHARHQRPAPVRGGEPAVQPRVHARARPAAHGGDPARPRTRAGTRRSIADLIANGPPNNEVPIERKIGVHITYFTAWVDEQGALQTARDVYGHEKRITQALDRRMGADRQGAEPSRPGACAAGRLQRRLRQRRRFHQPSARRLLTAASDSPRGANGLGALRAQMLPHRSPLVPPFEDYQAISRGYQPLMVGH